MSFRALTLQEQRAADFVRRQAQLGSFTLADLGVEYGISKGQAREVLRLAAAALIRQSKATSIPNRGSGWRQSVTSDYHVYGASIRDRLRALGTEIGRYEAEFRATGAPTTWEQAVSDMQLAADRLAVLVSGPGGATPGP